MLSVAMLSSCSPKTRELKSKAFTRARPPTYLSQLDYIDKPLLPSGIYDEGSLILSRNLAPQENPSAALVDAFLNQCLPATMEQTKRGPDIDVNVLDPIQTNVAPGYYRARIFRDRPGGVGAEFCAPGDSKETETPAGMAHALAEATPALTANMTYLPRRMISCANPMAVSLKHVPLPKIEDLQVSAIDGFFGKPSFRQCWATGQTASYRAVLNILQPALAQTGTGFVPDPLVHDGTMIHQTGFIQQSNGVTRTIVVSGPRNARLTGPKAEINIFVGQFVKR
jgi:hypothetical protein